MKLMTKRAAALAMLLSLAVIAAFAWSALGVSAAGNSVSVTLNPTNGSKATGTGTITDNGDGTITVVINETGLEPGDHIDHIHVGSCTAQGAIKYPLSNITADASGKGSSTTKVSTSFASVTAGGYYLNVHDLAKAGTSCGDIVLNAANAPAAAQTTAAAGAGTSASATTAAAGGQGGGNAPSAAPATGQGGAANNDAGFPVGLALIAVLALVVVGSGAALVRGRKSR